MGTDEDAPTPVLLARQPILDVAQRTVGYELLFRSSGRLPHEAQPEQATAHVIVAAAADLELEVLTGGLPAWINVSGDFLLTFDPVPLDPARFVLELLEDVRVDDALLARLGRLRAEGHRLALDDFVPRPDLEPLIALATDVKLDVRALGLERFAREAQWLREAGLRVLAEKVETPEERDACERAGAELFQGHFFEYPRAVTGRATPYGALGRLRAAVALQGEADFEAVERTVTNDPGLSVRLLRYANSAAVGVRSPVRSVHAAMTVLGARAIRQWALLVLLSELGQARPAVVAAALLRARICEQLARERGAPDPDAFFTVGLLSVLDALLDAPLAEVVAGLPLTEDVRAALLDRAGEKGAVLEVAVHLERGEAEEVDVPAPALEDAVGWSERALRELT